MRKSEFFVAIYVATNCCAMGMNAERKKREIHTKTRESTQVTNIQCAMCIIIIITQPTPFAAPSFRHANNSQQKIKNDYCSLEEAWASQPRNIAFKKINSMRSWDEISTNLLLTHELACVGSENKEKKIAKGVDECFCLTLYCAIYARHALRINCAW